MLLTRHLTRWREKPVDLESAIGGGGSEDENYEENEEESFEDEEDYEDDDDDDLEEEDNSEKEEDEENEDDDEEGDEEENDIDAENCQQNSSDTVLEVIGEQLDQNYNEEDRVYEQNDLNLVSQGEQRRQPYDNDYNQRNHAEQCVDSVNTVPNPYQILNQSKYQMTNNSNSSSGVQAQTQQHQYSIYMA